MNEEKLKSRNVHPQKKNNAPKKQIPALKIKLKVLHKITLNFQTHLKIRSIYEWRVRPTCLRLSVFIVTFIKACKSILHVHQGVNILIT